MHLETNHKVRDFPMASRVDFPPLVHRRHRLRIDELSEPIIIGLSQSVSRA